jgi:hypothetical protein
LFFRFCVEHGRFFVNFAESRIGAGKKKNSVGDRGFTAPSVPE